MLFNSVMLGSDFNQECFGQYLALQWQVDKTKRELNWEQLAAFRLLTYEKTMSALCFVYPCINVIHPALRQLVDLWFQKMGSLAQVLLGLSCL